MENIKVCGIKSENNLFCKTGRINGYRYEFFRGLGASKKEKTWDKIKKIHTCCGSRVGWRHKSSCKKLEGNNKWKELEY